jgi:MFS family permease
MAVAYFLIYGSIMVFQGTWSKVYFDSVYGFTVLSVWLVAMIGIGKIFSTVLVGVMAGRKIIGSKRIMMILGNVGFAAVWLAVWLFAGKMDSPLFWGVVCTLFGFFGGFMTLSFSQVKEWFPLSIAGTSVAAMNVFLFLGASVCTAVAGAIIGTSYTVENFSLVWGLMFAGSLAAVAAAYVSKENRE